MKKSISFGVSLTQKVIFNDDVYLIAFKEESQIANISVICEELPKNQLLEIDLNVSVDDTIQSLLDLENNE